MWRGSNQFTQSRYSEHSNKATGISVLRTTMCHSSAEMCPWWPNFEELKVQCQQCKAIQYKSFPAGEIRLQKRDTNTTDSIKHREAEQENKTLVATSHRVA